MSSKFATSDGTTNWKEKSADENGHFREAQGLRLSSIGIGTYLGNWDEATDEKYTQAVVRYVELGGNVIDTASNYRFQRSEKSIGAALKDLEGTAGRENLFIATKGGYLPFEDEPPNDVRKYFEENFVQTGIATFDDLVGGSHCMTPDYLQSQIDQSLENMALEGLDLFYIHNPETQLQAVDRSTFEARIAKAFERLEENRSNGKINFYGVATWNGFRVMPDDRGYHSLERFVSIAEQVGGDRHGFKFIQLPHNLAMPEAYLVPNQSANGKALSTLQAAEDLGVSVMVSASILQGKLAHGVPIYIRETLGSLTTDAQTSLQFVRSTPGVTTALVGMSSEAHVEENMTLADVGPVSEEHFEGLFTRDK